MEEVFAGLDRPITDYYPLVSVVISTFITEGREERLDFLDRALASVFAQDFGDFEVFVCDDGSTLKEALGRLVHKWGRRFADERDINLHYVRSEHNSGSQGRPYNMAIQRSNADYIAHLDDDDVYHPDHLSTLVRAMCVTGADLVYGNHRFAPTPHLPAAYLKACEQDEDGYYVKPFVEWNPLRLAQGPTHNFIGTPDMLYSRNAAIIHLLRYGGMLWREGEQAFNDWDFVRRWAHFNPVVLGVNEVLTTVYFHGKNFSLGGGSDAQGISHQRAKGAEAWEAVRSSSSHLTAKVAV